MAVLGIRIAFVVLLLTTAILLTKGEKWRAIAKAIRRCDGPLRPLEITNPKLSYTNRNEITKIDFTLDVIKDVKFTLIDITVYKAGGVTPLKFLTWQFTNPCDTIKKGHPYTEPIFRTKEIPQECEFTVASFPANITYDIHGEMIGSAFRGDYIANVKVFAGQELALCSDFYGLIKKDTLN